MLRKAAVLFTLLVAAYFFITAPPAAAYDHEDSPVKFYEYGGESLELAKKEKKPVFIFLSAVWCLACEVFKKGALEIEEIYSYLNENYISIFVDADKRRDLYEKYGANTLPHIVFLKPDGSMILKYSGVLKGGDFFGLLKDVRKKAYEPLKVPAG